MLGSLSAIAPEANRTGAAQSASPVRIFIHAAGDISLNRYHLTNIMEPNGYSAVALKPSNAFCMSASVAAVTRTSKKALFFSAMA